VDPRRKRFDPVGSGFLACDKAGGACGMAQSIRYVKTRDGVRLAWAALGHPG
jgi:hypothetical protein